MSWETVSLLAQIMVVLILFVYMTTKLTPVIKKLYKDYKEMRRKVPL